MSNIVVTRLLSPVFHRFVDRADEKNRSTLKICTMKKNSKRQRGKKEIIERLNYTQKGDAVLPVKLDTERGVNGWFFSK